MQKLEGIGQRAGGVAHDFNNLLAAIQMQSDLLKSQGELTRRQSVLEALGYIGLRAANGHEGLSVARRHQGPRIRLVVTGVVMPQLGGKVMAEWLKAIYPDVKTLFTSGCTDNAIARDGVRDPGVAFLAKPDTPATLRAQSA